MNLEEYINDAIQTESKIDEVLVNKDLLLKILSIFINAGNILDQLKKDVFYSKDIDIDKLRSQMNSIDFMNSQLEGYITVADPISDYESTLLTNKLDKLDIDPRLFHGLIGMITETTELAESLKNIIETGKIDKINIAEELGDFSWYQAILMDSLKLDWVQDILVRNNKKLLSGKKARYKEGVFSKNAAINRNITNEREILEENN